MFDSRTTSFAEEAAARSAGTARRVSGRPPRGATGAARGAGLAASEPRSRSSAATGVDASGLRSMQAAMSTVAASDDAARIDLIRALEEVKAAAAAAQAQLTVEFDASQRAAARPCVSADPSPQAASRVTHSIGAQVGLARRESPHRGRRRVRFATHVVSLPHTWARFRDGVLSEHRAGLIVDAIAHLNVEDQLMIDAELCADPATLEGIGDRRLAGWARRLAAELDPEAAARRASRSYAERRVSVRPCPEGMAWFSALLPMCDAVGAAASLRRAALGAKAAGDPRTIAQLMADTLVVRVRDRGVPGLIVGDGGSDDPGGTVGAECGDPAAPADSADRGRRPRDGADDPDPWPSPGEAIAATTPSAPAFRVELIMTDTAFFGHDDSPAVVPGVGHLPAQLARDLIARSLTEHTLWLRRLYAHPDTSEVVARDSTSRCFPPGLVGLIRLRDQTCRSPYCDAPIAHIDHVVPAARGGPTTLANGQGLCEACNYAKEVAGWSATAERAPGDRLDDRLDDWLDSPHVVVTRTPTGHRASSRPPAVSRRALARPPRSRRQRRT